MGQSLQSFDPGDLVLYEEKIRQFDKVRHILNMLDLVEAEVQGGEVVEFVEVLDVGDQVVVEVQLLE